MKLKDWHEKNVNDGGAKVCLVEVDRTTGFWDEEGITFTCTVIV